jgi:ABC-type polysaccharide/polyol phosphate export permease
VPRVRDTGEIVKENILMTVLARGVRDVVGGVGSFHVWSMLAVNDISRRYKRSRIGQLWLTISMAMMIVGMGIVFSTIFKIDTAVYIPFLTVSLIMWTLISTTINESCTTFIENEGFLRQLPLSRFTYLMRSILRNLIIGAHNLAIIPLVFVYYGTSISWVALLSIPGFLLVMINLGWIGYVLAIVSARFRDVPQIVSSILQVLFFMTPVMFKPRQLPPDHFLLVYNPGSWLLSIVRDPILGEIPSLFTYGMAGGLAVIGWMFAIVFGGRYSHRVVYWL